MIHTILLVDDEPNILEGLTRVLRKEPYQILTANSAEEAAGLLEDNQVDLIVSDEEMPGMSGTEFLARVAQDYPDTVGIVLTGHPTLPAALRAINEGKVHQFFTKPCNEIDLAITIRRALEQKDLKEKSRELLDVTKRQSALIEEARMLRRLRDLPHKSRSVLISREGQPVEQRELLEEIDDEIRRGKGVLRDVRSGHHDPDEAERSVASGALRED
ncbi:MAG: response regulator [Phycisphaerae bacterium]|nr:response regulator [Phycisphaerae bacterium]